MKNFSDMKMRSDTQAEVFRPPKGLDNILQMKIGGLLAK